MIPGFALSCSQTVSSNITSAIVIGAGGAGLMASVGLAESGLETACISKLVGNLASVCQKLARDLPRIRNDFKTPPAPSGTAETNLYKLNP